MPPAPPVLNEDARPVVTGTAGIDTGGGTPVLTDFNRAMTWQPRNPTRSQNCRRPRKEIGSRVGYARGVFRAAFPRLNRPIKDRSGRLVR